MDYIDEKYLNLLSPKLNNFKKKKSGLWNFRCPYCGDSQKNKFKSRGYIFEKSNELIFKCHNCQYGTNLSKLIQFVDPSLYADYKMEKFTKKKPKRVIKHTIKFEPPIFKIREKLNIPTIYELDNDHHAKSYIISRRIPEKYFNKLYYCKDFIKLLKDYNIDSNVTINEERIIIPFFDKNMNIIAFQGRSLSKSSNMRYLTFKIDENSPKIYGLDDWDESKTTFITEGPIDSMFLSNSLAMAGADLNIDFFSNFNRKNFIFVFDNEPRNPEIIKRMIKVVNDGFNINIWKKDNIYKDINDMVLSNYSNLEKSILENTFNGTTALMKINFWKKVRI